MTTRRFRTAGLTAALLTTLGAAPLFAAPG